MTQTEGSGGAGLIQFLRDRSSLNATACTCSNEHSSVHSNVHSDPSNNLMARIAPVLPKVSLLIIDNKINYRYINNR